MVTNVHHWIAGAQREGTSRRFSDVTDPATGQVTGRLSLADAGEVDAAVASARGAFPAWRDTSLATRTQIMFAFRELLNERKEELAEIITAEHGKVLSDALGEVGRGREVVEFACGMPHLMKGYATENASTGGRRALRPAAARAGRGDQPVQLSGHGADVVLPDRDRGRQHGRPQAQ